MLTGLFASPNSRTIHLNNLLFLHRCILDAYEGFVKVHVKEGTDKILGATIVAPNAGDMISEVTTAMTGSLGLGTISQIIHPYPTHSEAIRLVSHACDLFLTLAFLHFLHYRQVGDEYNRTRLTPTVKVLFRKLFAARR